MRDNHTGLIWEVKTAANAADTYTFDQAAYYATDTNSAGLCGHNSGWRVPTRRELLSIVHHGASSPSIDSDFFPNTQSSWYWSSDIYAPNSAYAWYVYFDVGYSNAYIPSYFHLHVRLVRSGQ